MGTNPIYHEDAELWVCGAFQPPSPALVPYRCTRPAGHPGDHRAVVGGDVVAVWPARGEGGAS